MNQKKRERNVNFTREETEILVSLVEAKKHIVENKKSDAETWQAKEKAWKSIAFQFNNSGAQAFRDAKHLKLKYEGIKRDIRKKASAYLVDYQTGSGFSEAPPLTPIEQKVKMILLSVEMGENHCDSDPLEVVCEVPESVVIEGPLLSDTNSADYSNNVKLEHSPIPRKRHRSLDDPEQSTSRQYVDIHAHLETHHKKWAVWKPLKSEDHPAICNQKETSSFDKLAEAKINLVELQKKLIDEELLEKTLRTEMIREEIKHKKEMYRLEKEQMTLKKRILEIELENKNK